MIAAVPIVVGFLGSLLPKVIDYFSDRSDKRHELEILDRQIELQKIGHTQRLEEIRVQADADELGDLLAHDAALTTDSSFISAMRASVRPVMTYLFFALFCAIKVTAVVRSSDAGVSPADMLVLAWDDETSALFSAIVSFWFGHRALQKRGSGNR